MSPLFKWEEKMHFLNFLNSNTNKSNAFAIVTSLIILALLLLKI